MRLIDAEIVLNRYQEICNGTACMDCPFNNEGCAFEKLILESALVDAEPVVKCKDCKYRLHLQATGGYPEKYICRLDGRVFYPSRKADGSEWYCADGERGVYEND